MKHVKKMSEEVEQIDELSPFSNLGGRLFRAKQTLGMYGDVVKSGVNLAKGANAEKTDKRGFVTNRNDPDVQKHFDAAEKNTDNFKRRANAIARTVQQKNPGKAAAMRKLTTNEEVEQVDEAQKKLKPTYWRAEWRLGTKSEVDKNNKKIYDRLVKTDPEKAAKFHDNLMKIRKEEVEAVEEGAKDWKRAFGKVAQKNLTKDLGSIRAKVARMDYIGLEPKVSERPVTARDKNRKELGEANDVTKDLRTSMKAMDLRHGVDADKRVAGYKMSDAVRKAQKKSDELSKVEKKPQAGTLAAQKSRKAAERMVNRAKGNANKIDVAPTIEPGKPNLQR
jgi:hypothetical protein